MIILLSALSFWWNGAFQFDIIQNVECLGKCLGGQKGGRGILVGLMKEFFCQVAKNFEWVEFFQETIMIIYIITEKARY